MPKYSSSKKLKSGLPIGGIGAGKFEILPSGCVDFITYQNNWSGPLSSLPQHEIGKRSAEGLLGFHFGIYIKSRSREIARLLQTKKLKDYPTLRRLDYDGSFPYASLRVADHDIPLKVTLRLSSCLCPGEYKLSSTPGGLVRLELENPTDEDYEVGFLIIWRNTVGFTSVGRFNEVQKEEELVHLIQRSSMSRYVDPKYGSFCITLSGGEGKVTYLGDWNMQGSCFEFSESALRLKAWDFFASNGELPNLNTKDVVQSESCQLGGALASKAALKAHQRHQITAVLAWNFPEHPIGHMYSNYFSDSHKAAAYLMRRAREADEKIAGFQHAVLHLPVAGWLKDALLNNLYPLVSSSWWGKDGSFSIYEAPIICPLMSTLDVRYYGSLPLALFFPELEKKEMLQLASGQRKDGYIPHDLGKESLDKPSDGTTFYRWKDLGSKFILLAYRDFLWLKDETFLDELYPSLKRVLRWQCETDKNGDFLPDNEGQDQTFDLWDFRGTNSYTSSIFLAALLAMEKMAQQQGDVATAAECRRWFKEGEASFNQQLWNGTYFIACRGQIINTACTSGQLSGQWYAHLLDLGYIVSRGKVASAVETILKLNGRLSRYGLVNSCLPNGKVDTSNLHSRNVWPGQTYAFAALAIYEGYEKEGLEIARKAWENFTRNTLNPWNQADNIDAKTGAHIFGDYYMRNMAVWALLLAMARRNTKINNFLETIRKHTGDYEALKKVI